MNAIPWKLTFPLDETQTLFVNEHLPYDVTVFLCHCPDAQGESVIHSHFSQEEYECPMCGNQSFYDADTVRNNSFWYASVSSLFSEEILSSLIPRIHYDDQTHSYRLQMTITIPQSFDMNRIGNSVYHSDGSYSNRIGNSVYNSDGSYSNRVGNTTFRSDGSYSNKIGNTYYHSDGTFTTVNE